MGISRHSLASWFYNDVMGEVFHGSNTSVCLVIRKDPVLFPVLEAYFMANNFSLGFHFFEFFSVNIQFNPLHVSHAKFANYFIQNFHTFTVIFLLVWSVAESFGSECWFIF